MYSREKLFTLHRKYQEKLLENERLALGKKIMEIVEEITNQIISSNNEGVTTYQYELITDIKPQYIHHIITKLSDIFIDSEIQHVDDEINAKHFITVDWTMPCYEVKKGDFLHCANLG
jgi:hypothetical protein